MRRCERCGLPLPPRHRRWCSLGCYEAARYLRYADYFEQRKAHRVAMAKERRARRRAAAQ